MDKSEKKGAATNSTANSSAKVKPPAKKQTRKPNTIDQLDGKKREVADSKNKKLTDDEDESGSDENGDLKVPLLDQPLELSGARVKKKVDRFIPVSGVTREAKQIEIPQGKGMPLKNIPSVHYQLSRAEADSLKALHRTLFNRVGNKNQIKDNILLFYGFTFDKKSSEYKEKLTALTKLKLPKLRDIAALLDLSKGGKLAEIAERILEFLMKPVDSGKEAPAVRPERKAAFSKSYKEATSDEAESKQAPKPESSNTRTKRKRNLAETEEEDDEQEEEEVEEEEAEEKETVVNDDDVDANEEIEKEKEENGCEDLETDEAKDKKTKKNTSKQVQPKKKALAEKKRVGTGKKQNSANTTKKGQASSSSGAEDENGKSKDEVEEEYKVPEKKMKNPPSDEEIKTFVKTILDVANLEKITMKTVCQQVYEHYPDFDLSNKKEFIKNTVKSFIA